MNDFPRAQPWKENGNTGRKQLSEQPHCCKGQDNVLGKREKPQTDSEMVSGIPRSKSPSLCIFGGRQTHCSMSEAELLEDN